MMTEQYIQVKQNKTAELDTLYPSTLMAEPDSDTNPSILIGSDVASAPLPTQESEETAEAAPISFESFFDHYVQFANDPSPEYVYDLPARFKEDKSVHLVYDRAEVAAQKRRELQEYVRVAFVQGNISLDASNVHLSGQINVDTISDAIVTDGILRAQQRYDRLLSQSTELPTHVTISEAPAVDDQETATFFNQVKEFGARAFRAITLHSGEILLKDDLATRPLPTTKVEAVPAGSSR